MRLARHGAKSPRQPNKPLSEYAELITAVQLVVDHVCKPLEGLLPEAEWPKEVAE